LDTNSLYRWAISLPLPNRFKWKLIMAREDQIMEMKKHSK